MEGLYSIHYGSKNYAKIDALSSKVGPIICYPMMLALWSGQQLSPWKDYLINYPSSSRGDQVTLFSIIFHPRWAKRHHEFSSPMDVNYRLGDYWKFFWR